MHYLRNTYWSLIAATLLSCISLAAPKTLDCHGIDRKGDTPFQAVTLPPTGTCKTTVSNGYPIPDPTCTPGAFNPSLTLTVLKLLGFGTKCVRDKNSTPTAKAGTYDWYGIAHPTQNTGANQVCELDHLVSLEIGGADSLDNIWPQCGPDAVTLNERYFKQKDLVENFLAAPFRAGKKSITLSDGTTMTLAEVQKAIAKDWTQFLPDATAYYKAHKKRNDGG